VAVQGRYHRFRGQLQQSLNLYPAAHRSVRRWVQFAHHADVRAAYEDLSHAAYDDAPYRRVVGDGR
jgi:hypothetical protein